jgi:heme A synthase
VPIGLALAHQAMAIVVLTLVTVQAAWLRPQPARLGVATMAEQGT